MRPGMPLGRKHFRRSRDAPTGKGLLAVLSVFKDLILTLEGKTFQVKPLDGSSVT
jgi:hypothetical protein